MSKKRGRVCGQIPKHSHKAFLERLGRKLNVKSMEDWYNVTTQDIDRVGGTRFLKQFNGSHLKALQTVFSSHKWKMERFISGQVQKELFDWLGNQVGHNIHSDTLTAKVAMDWLGEQLSIKCLSDWYRVSLSQVRRNAPIGTSKKLALALQTAYPEHQWESELLGKPFRAAQRQVAIALQQLFPAHTVKEDYKHLQILRPSSSKPIELDLYIEELKLAVEYQGEHHYKPVYLTHTVFETQKVRDREKREGCKQSGITLIEVPYWWDKTKESLAATIYKIQPKLVPDPPGVDPIPDFPPQEEFSLPLSHGQTWDGVQDITHWWMSEKMDGIRAYWDGKTLYSRLGNAITCPLWVVEGFPTDVQLDGELWMGRGTSFEDINTILRSGDLSWSGIGYYVFDLPVSSGTFEDRMKEMEDLKWLLPSHVHVVQHIKCTGEGHLSEYLTSVVRDKGEGVMIRQPNSLYERGMTNTLLKVKRFEDTEVEVLEVLDGNLRSNGLTCTVQCPEGTLGNVPPLGATIVVKHDGCYSTGALKKPIFWRSKTNDQSTYEAPNWTQQSNHKAFFDHSAHVFNICKPTDWYNVKKEDVYREGGQQLLQQYYNNSLNKALIHWYPSLKEVPWMFEGVEPGFWKSTDNHKRFFDWLFCHLGHKSMDDWYNTTSEEIIKNGGVGFFVLYYKGSPSKALQTVYPEHKWDIDKFHKPLRFWKNAENHRLFFDKLSVQRGHESMDDWYKVSRDIIYKTGGGALITHYYGDSPSKALQSVYPEHNWILEKSKNKPLHLRNQTTDQRKLFLSHIAQGGDTAPRGFWKNTENHKEFFKWLGHQLEYKEMDDWYSVTKEDINRNGGSRVLSAYYSGSPAKALMSIYPDHNWELNRFKTKHLDLLHNLYNSSSSLQMTQ